MRTRIWVTLAALLLATGAVFGADGTREGNKGPARAPDTALTKELALDVRSAPLADVVEEMATASGVRMRLGRSAAPLASTGAGDQRITLYSDRASVAGFQRAVAALLRLKWTRGEVEAPSPERIRAADAEAPSPANPARVVRFTLEEDPQTRAEVTAFRFRRVSLFLESLRTAAEAERRATGTVASRQPPAASEVQAKSQEPGARSQGQQLASLIAPLDSGWRTRLAQSGSVALPLMLLPDEPARVLYNFAIADPMPGAPAPPGRQEPGAPTVTRLASLEVLAQPQARVQYRLFYGDRATDTVLHMQLGVPGTWATATLPSIADRKEDGSALYTKSRERPTDASVWRRLPPRFSLAGAGWDEALARIGRAMKIAIASDAYRRPAYFGTEPPLPSVAGLPLIEALDRLCEARGMFWFREGDWYCFRSRTWIEEENVAVPDRFHRRWAESVRQSGRLMADDLDLLGTLGEEQLMTLNLPATTAGGAGPTLRSLDPDGAWLAGASLTFFRSLAPVQRELALNGAGLPAVWLTPIQQQIIGAIAAEYGFYPAPETLSLWGFRVDQRFTTPADRKSPVDGVVSLQWSFGPGIRRTAEVSIRE
jgi:hypothetical protein